MANDGTVKIGTDIDESGFKSGLSKLGKVAGTALKGTVKAVGGIATAAASAVTGLLALESATEEYRVAQGKLNTAFQAAGYSTETAKQAYTEFYKILGDTDTATEASQLLAKLATNEEDVSTWTNIAAGVFGTFGDSLPIEGLIESRQQKLDKLLEFSLMHLIGLEFLKTNLMKNWQHVRLRANAINLLWTRFPVLIMKPAKRFTATMRNLFEQGKIKPC